MITRNDLEVGRTYYMPTNRGLIGYVFMTKVKFRRMFRFRTTIKKYLNPANKARFTYKYEMHTFHENDFSLLYKEHKEAFQVYANIIVKEYNDVLGALEKIAKIERLLNG